MSCLKRGARVCGVTGERQAPHLDEQGLKEEGGEQGQVEAVTQARVRGLESRAVRTARGVQSHRAWWALGLPVAPAMEQLVGREALGTPWTPALQAGGDTHLPPPVRWRSQHSSERGPGPERRRGWLPSGRRGGPRRGVPGGARGPWDLGGSSAWASWFPARQRRPARGRKPPAVLRRAGHQPEPEFKHSR